MHIKFDHFYGFWNFITLCLNLSYQSNGIANNELLNAIYSISIPYTVGKISGIMWRDVIGTHKP